MTTTGLLLAAGAGRRMGRPKALVEGWLERAVASLAGCDDVVVVLGAAADEAARLVPRGAVVVVADDWAEGMGASLRAGLHHLAGPLQTQARDAPPSGCVVTLVDLPDVSAAVVGRLLDVAGEPSALARAAYDGTPGHPVLLGRDHWAGVAEGARGDAGARSYLRTHEVTLVECGDLAAGLDVDTPEALAALEGPSGPS